MDGVAYKDWLQCVVAPYAEQHNNHIYLLQDQFLVPAGYTPTLQVMDKGFHKPFKQQLMVQSLAWMVVHGKGEKSTQLDITNWVQVTWDQVSVSTILNTWASIGICPFQY